MDNCNRGGSSSQASASGLFRLLFGNVEPVQVIEPALDQRVRARYQGTTTELSRLGFSYLCCYGMPFSVYRLLLVIPAVAILSLLPKRPVICLGRGPKIQECCALLIARDNRAYAEADCEGVKFHTAFTDGTLLVSANYETVTAEGPLLTKRWRACSVDDVWADHEAAVQSFEGAGRRVDERSGFRAFADLLKREMASI